MTEDVSVEHSAPERVVLDTSVLLGRHRLVLVTAARIGFFEGALSNWIIAELVRKRTEWVAERATRRGASVAELRYQLRLSRERINSLMDDLSYGFTSVDINTVREVSFPWLGDRDDWPLMHTVLAVQANTLVTENSRDFPLGQVRNGVLFLRASQFLTRLYARYPEAEAAVTRFLAAHR